MTFLHRVDDRDKKITCPHCGVLDEPELSESGPHIRADCRNCGKYMKFVRQNLPGLEREYWDNMKEPK
jgi:sarcosine oxidase delta subunit